MKLTAFKGIKARFDHAKEAAKTKLAGKLRHHQVTPSESESKLSSHRADALAEGAALDQRHVETVKTGTRLSGQKEVSQASTTTPQQPTAQIEPEISPAQEQTLKVRLLAKFFKKLIGAKTDALDNKEEVAELRKKKRSIKSDCQQADKALKRAENVSKTLKKERSSLTTKQAKATKDKKTDKAKQLQKQIDELETRLLQNKTTVETLQRKVFSLHETLQQARLAQYEAEENADGLLRFGVGFATSLRNLYKLQSEATPEARKTLEHKVTYRHPRLALKTDTGKVEVRDLQLTMKTISFEKNDQGHLIPVLGLSHLEGDIWTHLPGRECLKARIELNDVALTVDTGLGKAIHSYVTASNSVKALGGLLGQGVEAFGQIKPKVIDLTGEHASVHLNDCKATTVTALLKQLSSTPDTTAEMIFKKVGLNLTGHLQQFNLGVTGDIGVTASANALAVGYQPEIKEKKVKGITRRKVKASVGNGVVTINHGLPMVQKVITGISPTITPPPGSKAPSQPFLTTLPAEASTEGYASTKGLELEFNRQLEKKKQKKKDAYSCTDKFRVEATKLSARNTGLLNLSTSVDDLLTNVTVTHEDFGPEASEGDTLRVDTDMSSASVTVDVPEELLPQKLMGQQLTLTGQAEIQTGKTHVGLTSSKDQQHLNVDIPNLEVDVRMPVTARLEKHSPPQPKKRYGVHLPKNMALKASGTVDIHNSGSVMEVTPSLKAESNNRMYAEIGKETLPIDLKAKVSLDKLAPKLYTNEDSSTGEPVVTSVMSSGRLKLDAQKLGPVHVTDMSLDLSDADSGEFRANGIEVDFDSLSARDRKAGAKGIKLPWLPRMLLRHKKLTLSIKSPVKGGLLELNDLRSVTPRFVSTENAWFFDRFTTRLINMGASWILPKVQQFTVNYAEPSGTGKPPESNPPILNIKVGPVSRSIPLTGLDGVIARDGNTIPVAELLRQKTGMVLVRKKDVKTVESCLKEIRAGKASGLSRLTDMVLAAKGNESQSGLIHLIAQQLPVNECRKILAKGSETNAKLAGRLADCTAIFNSVPGLEKEAQKLSPASSKG